MNNNLIIGYSKECCKTSLEPPEISFGFGKKNIVDKIMYRCFTIVANVGPLLAGSGYGLFKSLRLWLSIQLWFRAVKDKISKKPASAQPYWFWRALMWLLELITRPLRKICWTSLSSYRYLTNFFFTYSHPGSVSKFSLTPIRICIIPGNVCGSPTLAVTVSTLQYYRYLSASVWRSSLPVFSTMPSWPPAMMSRTI